MVALKLHFINYYCTWTSFQVFFPLFFFFELFMSFVPNGFLLYVHKLSRGVVVVAGLEVFGIGTSRRVPLRGSQVGILTNLWGPG